MPNLPGEPSRSRSIFRRITVPKTLRVANAGHLDGVDSLGNEVTFRYTSVKPSWRMDFAIAKYGELSAGAVRIFYLPDDRDGASGLANAGTRCLELFTRWFGPLRGTTGLTVIEIPDGWGSQTDVACIIQTAAAFRDTTRYRELYHEISHMWNVTPTDRPSPRWNEGLASYLELCADEELSGRPVTGPGADRTLAHLHKRLPGNPRWRDVPMFDYGRTGMAGLSYSMGAVFPSCRQRQRAPPPTLARRRPPCASRSRTAASLTSTPCPFTR